MGRPDPITLRSVTQAEPLVEALMAMGKSPFPFTSRQTGGRVRQGRVSVRLPLHDDERLFGMGLQFLGMNIRGHVYELRIDHFRRGRGRTHAPVPFYVSSGGYGVLFNTSRPLIVYPGIGNRKDSPAFPRPRDRNTDSDWQPRPTSDAVEVTTLAGGLEVLVFAGPTTLDAVRRYNLFFGGGVLPPKWGLGFWHRVPTNATATEVEAEVAEFEKRNFPLEVIGLEPGWHSRAYPCTFDWNTRNFPDPAAFLSRMTDKGIRINLWENPYVSPESSLYGLLRPLSGSHTVWLGIVPDLTLPEARDVLSRHHQKTHLSLGVSGYKIDEVDGIDEWLWLDHAHFPSGIDGVQLRQIYGLLMQKTLSDLFRSNNQRTYGLMRGSNGAASSLPFVLYSDHYNHKDFVTALANSGFSGVLWTPEIRSARNPEDWVRRMQTVCLSPMAMLNAWASKTKPWSMPEVNDAIREAMQLRMRLIPYLYNAFARYRFEGTPPFRAMALDDPSGSFQNVTDQYMVGPSLMAAPLFGSQSTRTVRLPKGKWYDFYTGSYRGSDETITVSAPLNRIPLFARNGATIPLGPVVANTQAYGDSIPLELRHYGDGEGSDLLYDDDGTTFDYEDDDHKWWTMRATRDASGGWEAGVDHESGSFSSSYGPFTWTFMPTGED